MSAFSINNLFAFIHESFTMNHKKTNGNGISYFGIWKKNLRKRSSAY